MIGHDRLERSATLAARAQAWLRRLRWPSARSRGVGLKGVNAPRAAEFVLAALVAVLCAGISLDLVAPLPAPRAPATSPGPRAGGEIEARNPFASPANTTASAAPAAPAAVETTLDLKLFGTWTEAAGPGRGAGTAIIRTPDGKQKTYAVGDAICCGARLDAVYADRVVIVRDGVRESLRLPSSLETPAARSQPRPEEKNAAGGHAESLRRLIRAQPVPTVGGVRFALFPAGDAAAFQALGLREGDVVLQINGAPAPQDAEGFGRLINSLTGAGEATLTVERDGVATTVRIALTPGG